jgi:autophagy-related protein 5
MMFLTTKDSMQLWGAVTKHDFSLFNPINQKLLNPQGVNLRHLPVRLYLPHAAVEEKVAEESVPGSLRVVQSLVSAKLGSSKSC